MTHGPVYKTNGKRPVWLKDGDGFLVKYCGLDPIFTKACGINDWSFVEYIRLPADHWASRVIEAGLEPWAGGDEAPEDWDGGRVLFRNGSRTSISSLASWEYDPLNLEFDIIGYKKKESVVSDGWVTNTDTLNQITTIELPGNFINKGNEQSIVSEEVQDWAIHLVNMIPTEEEVCRELARMIQTYEPHRKPKDRDEEIAEKWARGFGGADESVRDAILSAIKEAKSNG